MCLCARARARVPSAVEVRLCLEARCAAAQSACDRSLNTHRPGNTPTFPPQPLHHGSGPGRHHPRRPLHRRCHLFRFIVAQQEARQLLLICGEKEAQSRLWRRRPPVQGPGASACCLPATRASSSGGEDPEGPGAQSSSKIRRLCAGNNLLEYQVSFKTTFNDCFIG